MPGVKCEGALAEHSGSFLHCEYDLAESVVGFEASMSILDLLEREDGIDHWLNCSLGQ